MISSSLLHIMAVGGTDQGSAGDWRGALSVGAVLVASLVVSLLAIGSIAGRQ